MSKYSKGDLVRVIARKYGHLFKIGEVLRVSNNSDSGYYMKNVTGMTWYLDDSEVEPAQEEWDT